LKASTAAPKLEKFTFEYSVRAFKMVIKNSVFGKFYFMGWIWKTKKAQNVKNKRTMRQCFSAIN
jgi:hypothetical protein